MFGMTNEELIQKAVITTAAIAAAGKLNPEQADEFINLVVDVTGLGGKVRVVRFRNDQLDIDKLNVGKRVAVPKAEATAPGVRRGVTATKVTLEPKEIMVPFEISDEFLTENLQGESVEDLIIQMMATQFANNLEELYIEGNTLGPADFESNLIEGGSSTQVIVDSFMALANGWLKLAGTDHVVDANGADISSGIFSEMIKEMPDKWKRVRRNMKFFVSTDHEQNYRQSVASRATAAGDVALSTTQNLTPFGIELMPLPLLPSTPKIVEHVTLAGTTAVPLLNKNIVAGSEIVTLATLGSIPTTPFVGGGTDYTMDYANGTIARVGGGAISDPSLVKVTYKSEGQMWLTDMMNMILAIGRDIRIESDRDIFKSVNQWAITARVDVKFEETDRVVLGKNVGLN